MFDSVLNKPLNVPVSFNNIFKHISHFQEVTGNDPKIVKFFRFWETSEQKFPKNMSNFHCDIVTIDNTQVRRWTFQIKKLQKILLFEQT